MVSQKEPPLDIEGAEAEVLADSGLWVDRVRVLVAELHEWIVPGVQATYAAATTERSNRPLSGEKVMSIRPRLS